MREPSSPESIGLSHPAREVLLALERNGASFFGDLVRQTGRLASEIEDGLWELLAGGFVTADGFDNLRALIDPKRRREGRARQHEAAAACRRALGFAAAYWVNDPSRRPTGTFRASIAGQMGRPVARFAGPGNTRAAMAGSVADTPQAGSARRDSWRKICFRLYRRAVCPAGSA